MVYQRMMKGLFVYGIFLSTYHIRSRRRTDLEMSRPIFHENLKEMFPVLESLPHADTPAIITSDYRKPHRLELVLPAV